MAKYDELTDYYLKEWNKANDRVNKCNSFISSLKERIETEFNVSKNTIKYFNQFDEEVDTANDAIHYDNDLQMLKYVFKLPINQGSFPSVEIKFVLFVHYEEDPIGDTNLEKECFSIRFNDSEKTYGFYSKEKPYKQLINDLFEDLKLAIKKHYEYGKPDKKDRIGFQLGE
jgi:hypothetical protein